MVKQNRTQISLRVRLKAKLSNVRKKKVILIRILIQYLKTFLRWQSNGMYKAITSILKNRKALERF